MDRHELGGSNRRRGDAMARPRLPEAQRAGRTTNQGHVGAPLGGPHRGSASQRPGPRLAFTLEALSQTR